mgnify:CR=1 FL=1
MDSVSIIIPAYNEAERIGTTLRSLVQSGSWFDELIVVDDGSGDGTSSIAKQWTDQVVRLEENRGKGYALTLGSSIAKGDLLLFLDADLEKTAALAKRLLPPIAENRVEMTVAILPPTRKSGFGLVKRLARWGIYRKTGVLLQAPLSGQRAIRKDVFQASSPAEQGFGFEVDLTVKLLKRGYQIEELEIPFSHRETGKDVAGFIHRFRQGVAVSQALFSRR